MLGEIQRMQISEQQALFLQFLIKLNNITSCLEIGTFTGFSALSIALALPIDGKLVVVDKDKETIEVAQSFFKKAKVAGIKLITTPLVSKSSILNFLLTFQLFKNQIRALFS